jgi:metallo-beta-lactamase class B
MSFHDGRFAHDTNFVFHLFDQIMRHSVAKEISIKFSSNTKRIEEVQKLINDNQFEKVLNDAIKHPKNPDSIKTFKKVMNLITVASASVPNSLAARNAFISKGVIAQEAKLLTHTDGAHSEWYWRREFGAAYTFLFPAPSVSISELTEDNVRIYPNPSKDSFQVESLTCLNCAFILKSSDGKLVLEDKLQNGKTIIDSRNFKRGVYFLEMGGQKSATKLVVE